QYSNPAYYLKYTSDLFETKWLNNKTYPLEDGYRYRKYKEQKVNVEADFEYKLDIHSFLIGLYTQQTKILKDETYRNYVFNEGLTDGFYYYDKLLNRPENPEDRTQKAVFFQDYVDITDWLSLTIGARYDDFSDIGNELSPRLATVFRIDDINILKFQISRAFRPPTFYENYGYMSLNKLNPETVDTIETSYIYNDKTKTFRVTLFDSNIKNMITQDYSSYYFINLKDEAKLSGVELEFKMLADFAEFGINSAFYNSKNRQTGNEFALSASYMGNIFLTFNPKSDYSTSFWYRYISKKPRLEDSSNGYIPAQDYLNITQAFENIVKNGDLHVGVRNIFDEVQTTLYAPLNPQNYDDIPYMRRSFWINFSYRF
ncbi:MAG: TonB-dependent receptor, partial [Campylobacterales bacterium]|nr:TonB-dependent receptor [Campylobacterales bacterium]